MLNLHCINAVWSYSEKHKRLPEVGEKVERCLDFWDVEYRQGWKDGLQDITGKSHTLTVKSLANRNLKKSNSQKHRVEWWLPEAREWEKWDVGQGYKLPVIKWIVLGTECTIWWL